MSCPGCQWPEGVCLYSASVWPQREAVCSWGLRILTQTLRTPHSHLCPGQLPRAAGALQQTDGFLCFLGTDFR